MHKQACTGTTTSSSTTAPTAGFMVLLVEVRSNYYNLVVEDNGKIALDVTKPSSAVDGSRNAWGGRGSGVPSKTISCCWNELQSGTDVLNSLPGRHDSVLSPIEQFGRNSGPIILNIQGRNNSNAQTGSVARCHSGERPVTITNQNFEDEAPSVRRGRKEGASSLSSLLVP